MLFRSDASSSIEDQTVIDAPNALGFRKITIRKRDAHHEGVLDKDRRAIIPPLANLLVIDITKDIALVQMNGKYLFVPLANGPVAREDLESIQGFQYASPYQCEVALVVVDDRWFYINREGARAFDQDFDFAEPFHMDRALEIGRAHV